MPIAFDCGSFNLVCSRYGENKEIKTREEVNAFLQIPLDTPHASNMLRKNNIKAIEKGDVAYIIGKSAVDWAYLFNLPLRRPMSDGCLNPKEKEAYSILSKMIYSMIGEVAYDKEVLYYSVPANAVNQETDVDFHQKVLDQIFKAYKFKDKTIQPYPMNEALALVFAELGDKNYTGIGISCGSGMLNVCYSVFSQPLFSFSMVNSGDWIDRQVAKAIGETPTIVNKEKTKVDLLKFPLTPLERAVQSQYRILMEKVMSGIKKSFSENNVKIRTEQPLDFILGGGVALINGFETLFKEIADATNLPIPIGEIKKPKDCLYAVARGLLVAADNAT